MFRLISDWLLHSTRPLCRRLSFRVVENSYVLHGAPKTIRRRRRFSQMSRRRAASFPACSGGGRIRRDNDLSIMNVCGVYGCKITYLQLGEPRLKYVDLCMRWKQQFQTHHLIPISYLCRSRRDSLRSYRQFCQREAARLSCGRSPGRFTFWLRSIRLRFPAGFRSFYVLYNLYCMLYFILLYCLICMC